MGTLVAVLLLIASIALWNGSTESSVLPDNPAPAQSLKEVKLRVSPASAQPQPFVVESPINAALSVELRPEEVIGDIECNMKVGRGRASDSAVVLLPTFDGARFSVLDSDGTLASGGLPFRPHIVELGIQLDGTPVVGFGDLRLNSNVFRDADSAEPVRILVGDQIVYESDKAWDFLVASDGSSFAVHEPLADGGSRLVVNNLQTGEEQHFDLGTQVAPHNDYEPSHTMKYSLDGSEIVLQRSDSDTGGLETYWFYPTGEGKVRRVEVEGGMGAVLVSSSEGYFVDQPLDLSDQALRGTWRVSKRQFDSAAVSIDEVWSRTLDLGSFGGDMFVSDNGKWLAVDGWDFHVLDTDTGNAVFKYPVVGNVEEQVARLRGGRSCLGV
ncbi:MAG: hypothetical protein OXE83_13280 [Gammaproteobacteria bacterium]|nr:hypothetical protein [Gammaproteobacteria bacterium]